MKLITCNASAGISGFPSPAADYVELPLSLDQLLVDHPSSTWFGRAVGRSMEGVGIYHGDILVIDRAAQRRNMAIVVASYNGEFTVKLLDEKRRLLVSIDQQQNMTSIAIDDADTFSVEGVIIKSIRLHEHSSLLEQYLSQSCTD
ncbi:translesion error-prone DNA polymerase V autoproteolytic subunit [Shewanella glacialipiscicola]|uniref:DNA polymerase V n=1 Tax=Shewanella glacialipiscicola TaxID=614069 RepID=A0ABQ6J9H4_9GAMM|nr:translesion error-prone DNA polymerase V autoproteolytic subunit [Shewanella glacialipiscicola]MCL1087086.1 translesion error-prone DNA polymerase V autoproteolytic subunit [Shewanella glacialipiscicola]GIU11949.1 DNA polymerase V [Shewanella glacialipiscicola]GMA84412.1 DNA polymerase V [Shewanella glacialipiscicola]GMA84503.1 DNA polymerase V [Shewanella glacialipiscicola]